MKFPAKHIQTANVVAMFMGEENAIELLGSNSTLGETQNQLSRA